MDMFEQIKASTPRIDLSREEEVALIANAARRDKQAAQQLLANYLPTLKKLVGYEITVSRNGTRGQSSGLVTPDDLRSAAVEGFYDAVAAFDPARHYRLAQVIQFRVRDRLRAARNTYIVTEVPHGTASRFAKALAAADGNYARARDLAPSFGLTGDTFDAVGQSYASRPLGAQVKSTHHGQSDDIGEVGERADDGRGRIGQGMFAADLDGSLALGAARTQVRIEDIQDAARALAALDAETRVIVETLFGIGDSPALSEREASAALGIPRTTLQRKAARALDVMRATLGA